MSAVPTKNVPGLFKRQEKMSAIHEGLADFFTYKLAPDQFFGEHFKIGVPYLREYRNHLCFNLTGTPHLKEVP